MTLNSNPEALLVHGGGLGADNDTMTLSSASSARTELATQMYFSRPSTQLVFSGGNAHGDDIPTSEARLMADQALRAGVPHYVIECEEESSSTIGNLGNSLGILQGLGVESVGGITGRVASRRAKHIARTIVSTYRPDFLFTGYFPSREHEGVLAYPREAASFLIAQHCLTSAAKHNIPPEELDNYFAQFKQHLKIADIKRKFTTYSL